MPSVVFEDVVSFRVELPDPPLIDVGLRVCVIDPGTPPMDRDTVPENPPIEETEMV